MIHVPSGKKKLKFSLLYEKSKGLLYVKSRFSINHKKPPAKISTDPINKSTFDIGSSIFYNSGRSVTALDLNLFSKFLVLRPKFFVNLFKPLLSFAFESFL